MTILKKIYKVLTLIFIEEEISEDKISEDKISEDKISEDKISEDKNSEDKNSEDKKTKKELDQQKIKNIIGNICGVLILIGILFLIFNNGDNGGSNNGSSINLDFNAITSFKMPYIPDISLIKTLIKKLEGVVSPDIITTVNRDIFDKASNLKDTALSTRSLYLLLVRFVEIQHDPRKDIYNRSEFEKIIKEIIKVLKGDDS